MGRLEGLLEGTEVGTAEGSEVGCAVGCADGWPVCQGGGMRQVERERRGDKSECEGE